MNPVAPWMHDRPIRNLNPGDLRPRGEAPAWPGQDGLDSGTGGPFSIFVTASDGWAALGLWCLDARYLRGLRTAAQMIEVFAPPSENDTRAYTAGVVASMGAGALDLQNSETLERLCKAIAHWEESHDAAWPEIEIIAGVRLCTARWPAYREARLKGQAPTPTPSPAPAPTPRTTPPPAQETADQLNQQELQDLGGETET